MLSSERVNKGRRKLLTLTLLFTLFKYITIFFRFQKILLYFFLIRILFPDAQPSSCDILPIKSDNVVKPVLIPIKFYMFLMFYY